MEKEVKSLSTSVMALKFMHRAQEQEVRKKLEDEQKRAQEEAKWVLGDTGLEENEGIQFEFDNSHVPFLESSFGRRSFGQFNTAIESLAGEANREARLRVADENEKRDGVSDAEMVSRYQDINNDTNTTVPPSPPSGKRKRAAAVGTPRRDTDSAVAAAGTDREPQAKRRSLGGSSGSSSRNSRSGGGSRAAAVPPAGGWDDVSGTQATRFRAAARSATADQNAADAAVDRPPARAGRAGFLKPQ
ncbi:M-phase phosphoprotein 6 [Geranomyces michiganensis]|nr:M-phase phosphoprotein 6 [Geranomyces michiganensis]